MTLAITHLHTFVWKEVFNMNDIEKDEDRQWLKRCVRVLIKENIPWKQKKNTLRVFRQAYMGICEASEKDADSVIEGVLSEYSCKIQKRMMIKKPY